MLECRLSLREALLLHEQSGGRVGEAGIETTLTCKLKVFCKRMVSIPALASGASVRPDEHADTRPSK
jgi:hypothetical protein